VKNQTFLMKSPVLNGYGLAGSRLAAAVHLDEVMMMMMMMMR